VHTSRYNSLTKKEITPAGLEQAAKTPANPLISQRRSTESGTLFANSAFADAVAAIMRLPLTDVEKAEAVRRLLKCHDRE
jgi:hypothetical protein